MTSVGVDIGGTSTQLVRVGDGGSIEAEAVVPTQRGPLLVPATIEAIGTLMDGAPVARIGVGVPGQVDPLRGTVRLAVNLDLGAEHVHLGPAIEAAFDLPVHVENDVRAAALGAYRHLQPDAGVLAFLGIGTGVAAGIVIDGELHRGRSGMAGEIGHVSVDPDGPECACGLSGCVEALISGAAIRRRWRRGDDGAAAASLFRAAAAGDAEAIHVADDVVDHLVRTVHWLVMAYGADHVVLGGGVGTVGGPLLAAVHDRLRSMADSSPIVGHLLGAERVSSAPADLPLGALGAAVVAQVATSAMGESVAAPAAAGGVGTGPA